MLEIMPESQDNILGFWARGSVSLQDVHQLLAPWLENVVKDWGKGRMLLCLGEDFQGFSLTALRGDTLSSKHLDDLEKIAVVGVSWMMDLEIKMASFMLSGKVKTFAREELAEAWIWVKA